MFSFLEGFHSEERERERERERDLKVLGSKNVFENRNVGGGGD